MTTIPRCWAVVPAAGVGERMQAEVPKQYLTIQNKTILEHSINRLLAHHQIAGVVVAIAAHDQHWQRLSLTTEKPLFTVTGGRERQHSVKNALDLLVTQAHEMDWVLVHDAARPCLRQDDITRLMDGLMQHPVGGLLAYPVRDTMKRADENNGIVETVDRNALWHALTPQMFRVNALRDALQQAIDQQVQITDEAAAMERLGLQPKLVPGHADNIKITRPEDLPLAAYYFSQIANTPNSTK